MESGEKQQVALEVASTKDSCPAANTGSDKTEDLKAKSAGCRLLNDFYIKRNAHVASSEARRATGVHLHSYM